MLGFSKEVSWAFSLVSSFIVSCCHVIGILLSLRLVPLVPRAQVLFLFFLALPLSCPLGSEITGLHVALA